MRLAWLVARRAPVTMSQHAAKHNRREADGVGGEPLSDYEAARLRNIEANKAKLLALGIQQHSPGGRGVIAAPSQDTPARVGRRRKSAPVDDGASSDAVEATPLRRSKRATGAKPDYTGKFIDSLALGEDVGSSNLQGMLQAHHTVHAKLHL